MDTPTSQVRVLVASNKPSVASSTAKFLRNRKHEVVTCTSRTKMLDLLKKQKFHVVLAEHDVASAALKSDPIDGLELLTMDGVPPVIVSLDQEDAEAVKQAVRDGAADIIPLPMSQQQERLAALWQHVLQCQPPTSEAAQYCFSLEDGDLSLEVDTIKEEHFNLDDLELEPLAGTYKCSRQSDQSGADDPLFDVSSELLECSTAQPLTAEDNLHHMDTFSTDEVVSSVLSSFTSSHADRKRMWNSIDLDELLEASSGKSDSLLYDGSDLSGFDSDCDERKNNKRAKVEWTSDLHDRFVQAVEAFGAEKAVPSRILDRMGAHGTALTRQNIASHLQKYRHRFKGRGMSSDQPVKAQATIATPLVPPYVPGVPTSMGVAVAPTAMVVPSTTPFSAAPPRPQAGLPHINSHSWMPHPMQLWSPFPHGTIVYNHVGQPMMPASAVPTATFSQMAGCHAGPTSDDIQKAIRDVLSKPKAKAPLGLSLDAKKVLENLKRTPELLTVPGTAAA